MVIGPQHSKPFLPNFRDRIPADFAQRLFAQHVFLTRDDPPVA